MLGQREGVCRDRKWCRGCSRGAPCPPPALVKYRNVPSTSFDPFLMSTISVLTRHRDTEAELRLPRAASSDSLARSTLCLAPWMPSSRYLNQKLVHTPRHLSRVTCRVSCQPFTPLFSWQPSLDTTCYHHLAQSPASPPHNPHKFYLD